jgi:uncharacterized membrane protein YeaQ/YmgE (transglycosylase-associated protein family)
MKRYFGLIMALVVGVPLCARLIVDGQTGNGLLIAAVLGLVAARYDSRNR